MKIFFKLKVFKNATTYKKKEDPLGFMVVVVV